MASSNRVQNALAQWKSRVEELKNLHGNTVENNRGFYKERLHTYRKILRQNRWSATPAERSDLKIIRSEINRMERALYSRNMRRLRAAGRLIGGTLRTAFRVGAWAGRLLYTQVRKQMDKQKGQMESGDKLRDTSLISAESGTQKKELQNRSTQITLEPLLESRRTLKERIMRPFIKGMSKRR